ncbi:hypothetical protein HMPREF3216_00628 [Gardnerella vaginalis]|uniref:Uncharacterized protein n=1 Tax=Gardnerella vaginalis TaxID=2702 RepID=A0A133NPV3_GARVA|nr:hypothetical protein HMPREF3216_00628 [Gardnerella vaginalis]
MANSYTRFFTTQCSPQSAAAHTNAATLYCYKILTLMLFI